MGSCAFFMITSSSIGFYMYSMNGIIFYRIYPLVVKHGNGKPPN